MPVLSLQVLYKERKAASITPYTTYLINDVDADCAEKVAGVYSIPPNTGPIDISLGSIAKGKLLLFRVEEDVDGGRLPLKVFLNGIATDPWEGTLFVIESDDTVGITSLHVKNENDVAVSFRYYLGGDVV